MSIGLSLSMQRVGKGDPTGLFYALKERLLGWTWNVTSTLDGFRGYLRLEEVSLWMSDRWQRNETSLWFAFWEDDVEATIVEYSIHVAAACIVKSSAEIAALAKNHGFALDLAAFHAAHARRGRFAMHSSQRVCRVEPWRRGEPVEAAPRFVCERESTPHRAKPRSANQLCRIRASAMTGLCACKFCYYQFKPDLLTAKVPAAWAALDADPIGAALAERVADGEHTLVIADWLEQRGVVLAPEQLVALARSYHEAPAFE